MRLSNGEISSGDAENMENERKSCAISSGFPPNQRLVVGYALTTKKKKSFLQPKLELLARKKGILFVAIDQNRPLSDQGPFDIVLHKLTGKEWRQILEDYRQKHPEVTVLDPPDAIQHVHNRQSMLQGVADLNLSDCYGKVGVPKQLVIMKDPSLIPDAVAKAGLCLPLVAKPLVVDGSARSHELSLAFDKSSLSKLDPPLVLQEFVNHGGVLFKVYIVGEAIKVVRRFSLPDVNEQQLLNCAGVFRFPRVSCAAASAEDADLDPLIADVMDEARSQQAALMTELNWLGHRFPISNSKTQVLFLEVILGMLRFCNKSYVTSLVRIWITNVDSKVQIGLTRHPHGLSPEAAPNLRMQVDSDRNGVIGYTEFQVVNHKGWECLYGRGVRTLATLGNVCTDEV